MGVAKLTNPLADRELRRLGRMTALCIVVGLVAGLGAAGFFVMLEAGKSFCLGYLANYHPATAGHEQAMFEVESLWANGSAIRWILLVLPAIGGLLSGLIVFSLAPEAEGHGTDAAIEAYHFKDGTVRKRVPLVKAITSMITLGTGGSAGREGPIAQIGSGFGSALGQWLKVSPHERRTLMAAGMAAGIGAIFHAPLAGALFAAEVFYRDPDFEHETIVPGFISSIVAYSVFGGIFGFHPLFITPDYAFDKVGLLLPYLILAVVAGLGATVYVKAFYSFHGLMFDRIKVIPNHFKPAIGGILVGLVGFFLPEALGAGYGIVQLCFNTDASGLGAAGTLTSLPSMAGFLRLLPDNFSPIQAAALLLTVIAVAKIATTAFTVGSGGSGGVFGPAVVIGGALGGATGLICAQLFPGLDIRPGAFALVGMAGFFGGAANTPVSTIIMVCEMTGNYNLLVPAMLVCIVCYAICRRHTLYEKQLPSRLDAPSKLGNMASAILRRLTVHDALARTADEELIVVPRHMSLAELTEQFAHSTQPCFPVVDEKYQLSGVIDAMTIRQVVTEAGMGDLVIAGDIHGKPPTVTASESLLTAINHMVTDDREELVVVDEDDRRQIVGILSRSDIIAAYNRQIVDTAIQSA